LRNIQELKKQIRMELSPQIYVIPQNMLQKQSLLKLASHKQTIAPATAAPKYRVIMADSNKAMNEKIQISRPVATVVGCKRPASALSPPLSPLKCDIKEEDDDEIVTPMRKRANLDHLSPEERLQRRKLKNRVAAQNARDKKKAQTEEMEKLLDQMRAEKDKLQEENNRLQSFNAQLQLENASLIEENAEYKQKLGIVTVAVDNSQLQQVHIELPMSPDSLPPMSPTSPTTCPVSVSSHVTTDTLVPPESAALTNVPLLQEQGTSSTLLTPQTLSLGLSSPDLTPWVQSCVVTLSCVMVTMMMILRQSSTSPPPTQLSSAPPQATPSPVTSPKLPLKKRNWTWSHPPLKS